MTGTNVFYIYRSSAGSGKTRTLAKEYLKLALKYRADYFRHILAVTFTNKASQEMKDRILAYLDDFARGKPNDLAPELQQELGLDDQTFRQHSQEAQAVLLHNYSQFSISTIDAFFQRVIRSFTREAGLVGDYRLEVEHDEVLENVIDNLIEELGSNKELTEWVVEFARENLENDRAWDVRYSLIEFAAEIFREEFKAVEDELLAKTAQPGFFRNLLRELKRKRFEFINLVKGKATEALRIIHENGLSAGDFKYSGGPYNFFLKASKIGRVKDFGEKEKGKRPEKEYQSPANWPDKNTSAASLIVFLASERLIPLMNEILQYWDKSYKTCLSAEAVLNNFYAFGLIADISRKLREYKDEHNLMLLADAPKFLNGVIRDSDTPFIYEKVGSFYRNYLIDEFQDTSGMQWKNFQPLIVNSLDQGYPSMVVGDVKQAIYRWRGGDLNLLQEGIGAAVGNRVKEEKLKQNFRSAQCVVGFNNALFETAASLVSLETGAPVPLHVYSDVKQEIKKQESGFVHISFINEEKEPGPDGESPVKWHEQALENVPRILEQLQEQGASLQDIAILVRRNEEGQRIAAHLLQYKNSGNAKPGCRYDVVSNESLRLDGASSVNFILGAMRYLLNPDDAIARAQLSFEYCRVQEPNRPLSEVFAVANQALFESQLPDAFTKNKLSLRKLPLIELTETLIGIFDLGKITGELAYLQTFQDMVLEFYSRERNDLGAFLEWWEDNRHKRSIQIAGEVDAVQILTVHKSKGLQFRYVIVPFCSWGLDHDSWQAPNLWVRSDQPLFSEAGYVPVRYSQTLDETFFSEYYREERNRCYLDNLNLLYVAFTRAENGLIITAPHPDVRGTKGTVAGLLYQSIIKSETLKANWREQEQVWTSGEWQVNTAPPKTSAGAISLRQYHASAWRDKLVIRKSAGDLGEIDPESKSKIGYGIQIHSLLSHIRYDRDVEEVLDKFLYEGLITGRDREAIASQLNELLSMPPVNDWFTSRWNVQTEVSILLPGGGECRIDRLMTNDGRAIVADFKTGVKRKADDQQVLQYMEVLRSMNFTHVEGYLIYLNEKEVIEVQGKGKQRTVKKTKDKNQLSLGF